MRRPDHGRTWLPVMLTAFITAAFISCASPALAYFNHFMVRHNLIHAAETTIEIEENFDPVPTVTDDFTYRKEVKVRNTGTAPCYVRVFLDFSDPVSRASSTLTSDGTHWYTADEFRSHTPTGWHFSPVEGTHSGWYYYDAPLSQGEVTSALITKIRTHFTDPDDICPYDVIVTAESADTGGGQFTSAEAAFEALTSTP